ncbi:predicted protein [Coccidioides posadasii str. Silveira]|uniref:Predicted protein n=1 Tax=Coccidioides posadasii (strain RMSCC 757 / Silveira) TaxID=443226 RepID=E9D037_COCPS|nr:predicted protein [Coccidioides posadasii str. Silveira]
MDDFLTAGDWVAGPSRVKSGVRAFVLDPPPPPRLWVIGQRENALVDVIVDSRMLKLRWMRGRELQSPPEEPHFAGIVKHMCPLSDIVFGFVIVGKSTIPTRTPL